MPTIDEQLTALVAQKNSLAANLNAMGVTASESETLNTLVPKVLDIPTGGGGAVVQPLSVTQNGTYNPPSGVDGYAPVTVNVSGGGGSSFNGELITLLTLDQGSRWVDTGYDVSNVTDFLFFKYLSGQTDVYAPVYKAKSDIAVYTGGSDVYTNIFVIVGTPFNVRIYNNTLWVSFNGMGSNTNGALCYTGGNFADFMSTVQGN